MADAACCIPRRPSACRPALAHRPPPPLPTQIALLPDTEFESHPLAAEKGLAGEEEPHQRMLNRLAHEVAFRWVGGWVGDCGAHAWGWWWVGGRKLACLEGVAWSRGHRSEDELRNA